MFEESWTITGEGSAGDNYARGLLNRGKELRSDILLAMRRMAEKCDALDVMQFFNSTIGGTGSGVGSVMLNLMNDLLPGPRKFVQSWVPSPKMTDNIVGDLNTVLHLGSSHGLYAIRAMFQNDALIYEVKNILEQQAIAASFSHINHVVSLANAFITLPDLLRADTGINSQDLITNLVPYPTLNLVSFAVVPLQHPQLYITHTEYSLTTEAFVQDHEMCCADLFEGKYYSCVLSYRGDINLKKCSDAASDVRKSLEIPFVEWAPTGFTICSFYGDIPKDAEDEWCKPFEMGLTKISNHSAIGSCVLDGIVKNYQTVMNSNGYKHWYTQEGLDDDEFAGALEVVEQFLQDLTLANNSDEPIPE